MSSMPTATSRLEALLPGWARDPLRELLRDIPGKEEKDLEGLALQRLKEAARGAAGEAARLFLGMVRADPSLLRKGLAWARSASSVSLSPTPEQEAALGAFLSGEDLKLLAVAGSGKTTTLRLMAEAAPRKRLLYVAFNRAVKEEAARKFPRNVEVLTLHALARRYTVAGSEGYERKLSARDGRVSPKDILEALDLPRERYPVAYAVRDTLENFLRSSAEVPTPAHIPGEYREALRRKGSLHDEEYVLKGVRLIWRLMQDPEDPFPLSFDGFVKMWAQGEAKIRGYDAVLVDEAQDLSPVFSGVLERHRGLLQRVYVGDPRQQIYGWRGAVNAMEGLAAPEKRLTWSFRFGEALASGVRSFMASIGQPLEIYGKAPWGTAILPDFPPSPPFTVLCRTNAGVVDAVVSFLLEGEGGRSPLYPRAKVFVVGGIGELTWLLADAANLKEGVQRGKPHPELALVESWRELVALAEELSHTTARLLVKLGKEYDLRNLAKFLERAQANKEEEADIVVSTLHKAKGREWDRVVLWGDFRKVWDPGVRSFHQAAGLIEELKEEENALYVALTRPRKLLSLPELPDLYALMRVPTRGEGEPPALLGPAEKPGWLSEEDVSPLARQFVEEILRDETFRAELKAVLKEALEEALREALRGLLKSRAP